MKKKVNEEEKVEKKKIKKRNKKNKVLDYEEISLNERFILGIFILVAIVVCIIGCFVVEDRNNTRVIDNTDLVLPILESGKKKVLKLEAFDLINDRYYVIKVTNYGSDKKLKEDIKYSIDIENETKATIKLTKNDDLTNLIKNNKKTVITNQELLSDKKQEVVYYLSVVHDGGVIKGDKVKITFESQTLTEE